MSVTGSVSRLICDVQAGDVQAAERLWHRFFPRLTAVARQRLRRMRLRTLDEEDLASMALASFLMRARDGQFPAVNDRDSLWALLLRITYRKLINKRRSESAQRRGGGRVRGDSAWDQAAWGDSAAGLAGAAQTAWTPDCAAALKDVFRQLQAEMPDELRAIVLMRLSGHSHAEIARQVQRSVATIERRLRLVRHRWSQEILE